MNINKKKLRIISFSLMVITLLIFALLFPSREEMCEDAFSKAISESYHGIVVKKYVSSNHATPAFDVALNKDTIVVYEVMDISGYYDYLQVGDSVVKLSGTNKVHIFRMGGLHAFELNYNCN